MLILVVHSPSVESADDCQSKINFDLAMTTILGNATRNPVFSGGSFVGWRIYNLDPNGPLFLAGIRDTDTLTHVCGIAAEQLLEMMDTICCLSDTSTEISVTVRIQDKTGRGPSKTISIPRGT